LLVVFDGFGETQVSDLEGVVVHQEVGWLYVAMHDVSLAEVVETL
jgi:myo-inositol-hexaphosphate 3-phosphohydrolase